MEHQHNPVSSIDVILNWIYWCVQKSYSSLSIARKQKSYVSTASSTSSTSSNPLSMKSTFIFPIRYLAYLLSSLIPQHYSLTLFISA
jgi:hypothetical protein